MDTQSQIYGTNWEIKVLVNLKTEERPHKALKPGNVVNSNPQSGLVAGSLPEPWCEHYLPWASTIHYFYDSIMKVDFTLCLKTLHSNLPLTSKMSMHDLKTSIPHNCG